MSRFGGIKAIFVKDIVGELRGPGSWAIMVAQGLLLSWVVRMAWPGGGEQAAAAVVIIAVLFSAIVSSERIFAVEQQNGCIEALLLGPVGAGDVYIAKLLVNMTMLCVLEVIVVPAAMALFNVGVSGGVWRLVPALLLINAGLAGVGTLLGCAVQAVKGRGAVLSVVLPAAVVPIVIPAVGAMALVFGRNGLPGFSALGRDFRTIAGMLAAFDAIIITVCLLLFEQVVGE